MSGQANDEARWYFAYGSNMQAATLRGRRLIEPLDVRVGKLPGYRLCFDIPIGSGLRGVANIAIAEEADLPLPLISHRVTANGVTAFEHD